MQYRVTYNKFTVHLVLSLFVTITMSAHAENSRYQPLPDYSLPLAGGQSNPWALPQEPEHTQGFQRSPRDRERQYQGGRAETPRYRGYRFVTPEILESLKRQQMQTQQVPSDFPNQHYSAPRTMPPQYMPPQYMPPQYMPGRPGQGYYDYPSGGMGSSNPLFDVPSVSPWGSGPDVLYRGESFPWLPDAAIGGIPPIHVQPFDENSKSRESDDGLKPKGSNVFNPFTFGPNGNL